MRTNSKSKALQAVRGSGKVVEPTAKNTRTTKPPMPAGTTLGPGSLTKGVKQPTCR